MMEGTVVIRKTPFLFFKRLILVEFFFALLPLALTLLADLRASYEATPLAASVSYPLLFALGIATLQVLILIVAFVLWYFPVYEIDRERVLYRRANLFEDRVLTATQSITAVEPRQSRLGRRLGYGSLLIYSRGNDRPIHLRDVPDPARRAGQILALVEKPPAPDREPSLAELLAQGENQHVEFKSSLLWDYRRQKVNKELYVPVMKNIVAFLNTTGGTLLIGVDDEGQVLGLEPDYRSIPKPNADGFENVFNMAFNKMIGVEFRRFVDVRFAEMEGKEVCIVSVRPASEPAFLTHKGTETFYIRAGNATQPLSVSKATHYIREHFGQ